MTDVVKATPYGAIATAATDLGTQALQPGNVIVGPDGEVTAISYEAAPESHVSMVKYMAIGVIIIAMMLIIWLMSQGPVRPYEYKSILGFTAAPAQVPTNQRMYGVIPSLAGVGLSN